MRRISVVAEAFPIAGSFTISRGSRTVSNVVVATIEEDGHVGRGEALPYPRYRESVEGVVEEIEAMADAVAGGMDREALRGAMKAGAARNAIDCALFDLEAKATGVSVAERLGVELKPVTTAYTISIGEPDEMAEKAAESGMPLLKVKLGRGEGDAARIRAVRKAVPNATLIVDANEGWSEANLLLNLSACADAGVALVEQPLPAGRDGALATISHPVPICADESVHTLADLDVVRRRYDAANIKLDKAGGLTEAWDMVAGCKERELKIMVGCMVATSLSMAPALHIAGTADFVDLDAPMLLAEDRPGGLVYEGATIQPPSRELWG